LPDVDHRSGSRISELQPSFAGDQCRGTATLIRDDLDDGAAAAHLSSQDNEEAAMFIDATNGFPHAGRKPVREVSPAQIAERRKWFDKVLARYPNQPAHEAADVDALIERMLTDRKSITPFVDMINALYCDIRTGRTDLPTLKNCLLRNWRAMHGVGAPGRMAA
jgi:hypothetical protein